MTPSEVIDEVRRIIQDTRTTYRYSDAVLLGFVNQTLKRMVALRPDLFTVVDTVSTTADTPVQSLPADAMRLVDVFQVSGGNVVEEVTRSVLNKTAPNWMAATSGTPVNFMRHVRTPTKFFLYPPPASGTQLLVEYAKTPDDYGFNDTIDLSESYFPSLVDGTVFLAESIDNEHVNSGRAELFYKTFVQSLGASLQLRVLTDTDEAGMEPEQVI